MSLHPVRKRKLTLLIMMLLGIGLAVGLTMYALRQNISLYYTPSQIEQGEAPLHHVIRAGGMVVKGSIVRDGLFVHFSVTDYQHTLRVIYQGILPDLFREGQGVVVQGQLVGSNEIKAVQVLAKHDENYMPPEVRGTLKKSYTKKSI